MNRVGLVKDDLQLLDGAAQQKKWKFSKSFLSYIVEIKKIGSGCHNSLKIYGAQNLSTWYVLKFS
jgi:hypothetical protein